MTWRDDGLYAAMVHRGLSRRTFLQFSAAMAAALALPLSYAPQIAAAVTAAPRLPVIWLRGQGCGGDTRAFMQASDPTTAELLLDLLSIEYHEAIMARSGASAEAARRDAIGAAPNGYVAVVEGAIPLGDDGVYCTVGGRAFSDVVREVCAGSLATIAIGSCAFDGGAPAAEGGSTGSAGVAQVVPDATLINLPGCPVNVDNLTATIVHYLTFKAWPATDSRHRPLFAYGGLLHNQCERRAHFEFGEFVTAWGDEGSQKGWCLYKMGCKGPETFANCPTVRYAEGTSWPVKAGHGCNGCTMPGFWDSMSPTYGRLPPPLPFAPQVSADQLGVALVGAVAALTVVHGTASAVRLRRWGAEERRAAHATQAATGAGETAIGTSQIEIDAAESGVVDDALLAPGAIEEPIESTGPAADTGTVEGAAGPVIEPTANAIDATLDPAEAPSDPTDGSAPDDPTAPGEGPA